MGSARRLLLIAALALAIAAGARTDATLSTLTLSPDAGSLITTRDDLTMTGTSSITAVIGSAASDSTKVTKAPVTDTPPTTKPPTTTEPPATTAPTTSIESDASSASDGGEQETAYPPSSVFATVSPGSTSDRSTHDSESQTDVTTAASTSTSSKSSTASVDTLNNSGGGLSAGNSSSMGTIIPAALGALACVGAIVMAITYKKKRGADGDENDSNRSNSDCEYANGADFTPDNRALSAVREDLPSVAIKMPGLGTQNRSDTRMSASIADFTGSNSSVSSTSPFGTTRCKVRVSSPNQSLYSSSETNMEFQDTCPRHDEGSNVVLTFDEVPTDSKHAAPQVLL